MCRSRAQGGRRCAAHTRPAFAAALAAVNTAPTRRAQVEAQVRGLEAVAFHAATPTGGVEVASLIEQARRANNVALAGFLSSGQSVAVGINEGFAEVEAQVAAAKCR